MRSVVRNKERWKGRRAPTQDPSTNHLLSRRRMLRPARARCWPWGGSRSRWVPASCWQRAGGGDDKRCAKTLKKKNASNLRRTMSGAVPTGKSSALADLGFSFSFSFSFSFYFLVGWMQEQTSKKPQCQASHGARPIMAVGHVQS